MARSRRTSTPEFKLEAVTLVTAQGYAFAAAARSLGLNENLSRSWKRTLEAKGDQALPGQGTLPAIAEELRCLRAEPKRLRAERDLLTQAPAFFAREATGPSASSTPPRTSGPYGCWATPWRFPLPATRLGSSDPAAPTSSVTMPWWSRAGPSRPSSSAAPVARASMPNWELA